MKVKSQEKKSIQLEQEEFRNASITVTKQAVKRLKAVMKSEDKDNQYLRMSVESGGCSGMLPGPVGMVPDCLPGPDVSPVNLQLASQVQPGMPSPRLKF